MYASVLNKAVCKSLTRQIISYREHVEFIASGFAKHPNHNQEFYHSYTVNTRLYSLYIYLPISIPISMLTMLKFSFKFIFNQKMNYRLSRNFISA